MLHIVATIIAAQLHFGVCDTCGNPAEYLLPENGCMVCTDCRIVTKAGDVKFVSLCIRPMDIEGIGVVNYVLITLSS